MPPEAPVTIAVLESISPPPGAAAVCVSAHGFIAWGRRQNARGRLTGSHAVSPDALPRPSAEIGGAPRPSFEAFLGAIPKRDATAADDSDIQIIPLIPRDVDL